MSARRLPDLPPPVMRGILTPSLYGEDQVIAYAYKTLDHVGAPDLLRALQALLSRHNDGSSEGPWAEWDTASEAVAKAVQP